MNEVIKWLTENVFQEGRLAVILVLIFIAIFIGVIPSPMLFALQSIRNEHRGMELLFRQICVNTSKTQEQTRGCFYQERSPGVIQEP